jgi:hypothetical protein
MLGGGPHSRLLALPASYAPPTAPAPPLAVSVCAGSGRASIFTLRQVSKTSTADRA